MDLSFSDDCDSLFTIYEDDGDLDEAESALPESLGFEEGQPQSSWCPPESHDDGMPNGVSKEPDEGDQMQTPSNSKMPVPDSWEGGEQLEVVIYAKAKEQAHGNSYKPHVRESAQVLARAFGMTRGMDDVQPSLAEVLTDITSNANYEVVEVVRIQNPQRYSMYMFFKQTYDIPGARIVYHGTTRSSAASIATTGFRGAVSQRAKYGKGIYCSSNVWEALPYAEPEQPTLTQTFLVVDMLQGPTKLGWQDQVDFGVDSQKREILTTTNPESTIFCAKYENQLLATYRITVRFLADRQHTTTHYDTVRMYHPTIWKIIKEQKATVGHQSIQGPPAKKQKRVPRDFTDYKGIENGAVVIVQQACRDYTFCNGFPATVMRIHDKGSGAYQIFVEMCDKALAEKVRAVNKNSGPNGSWMVLKIGQIQKHDGQGTGVQDSAPGGGPAAKRPGAMTAGDQPNG
jgi:hypothetical protein